MKIEVSFDSGTKHKFREECIRRLQKFVHTMKEKQPPSLKAEQEGDKNSNERNDGNLLLTFQDIIEKKISKKNNSQRKENERGNKEDIGNKKVKNVQYIELAKQQNRKLCELSERNKKNAQNNQTFNIKEIRSDLDRIIQKIQATSRCQSLQNQHLQGRVNDIDKKLDLLINYIQQNNLTAGSNRYSNTEREKPDSSNWFELKFNQLATRYNHIKQNSVRSNGCRGSRSVFSLQSTGDSMTFRQ